MRECKRIGHCPFADHDDCTCYKETQVRYWRGATEILMVLEIFTLLALLYIGWR